MIQILYQLHIMLPVYSRQVSNWIKKEMTRLKLRRRGSFAGSTWVSLALRPYLEKEFVKVVVGAPLAAAVLAGGVTQLPETEPVLSTWSVNQPVQDILDYENQLPVLTEEKTYQLPVLQLTGISQYFHQGHLGIDLRAPLQSVVVAMDEGVVLNVESSRFGYGTRVELSHGNNLETMYAHLGLVVVEEGEKVLPGEKLAEIGMTGWSTGPHLHFEVREKHQAANPIPYLRKAIEEYTVE